MDERELAAQLSLLLGEELADRIPDLNRVVLALERESSSEELHRELHRLLHVVKGASRSAGIVAGSPTSDRTTPWSRRYAVATALQNSSR